MLLLLISVLLLPSKPCPVHEHDQHFFQIRLIQRCVVCADLFLSCLQNHVGGYIHGYFLKVTNFEVGGASMIE